MSRLTFLFCVALNLAELFLGGCASTPAEAEALTKLKAIIKDEELTLDYMKDAYLLTWLHKHKFDVRTTAEKIRAAHEWRKQNNVDNILNEDFSVFKRNSPFDIEGVDLEGRPVLISQIGKWDLRRIHLSGLGDKYDRYGLYLQEMMAKKIRERNEKHPDHINYGYLVLADLAGFNLRQHGCIRCIQSSMKFEQLSEAAYPDRPYKSIMINAPSVFAAFYSTVKSLLPDLPYPEFEIYDFDKQKWQKALLKVMAADQIPTQYGGTRKTNLL